MSSRIGDQSSMDTRRWLQGARDCGPGGSLEGRADGTRRQDAVRAGQKLWDESFLSQEEKLLGLD